MTIAFDMDNVIVDWEEGLSSGWQLLCPKRPPVMYENRKNFHASEDYPPEDRALVEHIYMSPGFYSGLLPLPGALPALKRIQSYELDAIIVTAPHKGHPTCAQEKVAWVQEHLGSWWVERLYICRDKTRIRATVLVDDKPEITGAVTPSWEHIIFSAPYNLHVTGKRRMDWRNWREVLGV